MAANKRMELRSFLLLMSAVVSVTCLTEDEYLDRRKEVLPHNPTNIESWRLRHSSDTSNLTETVLITTRMEHWVIQLEVDRVGAFFRRNCLGHNFTVYDGETADASNFVKRYCGADRPTVRSTGPHMVVVVVTNEGGISFRASAVEPGLTAGEIVGIAIAVIVVVGAIITALILCAFRDSVCGDGKSWKYESG